MELESNPLNKPNKNLGNNAPGQGNKKKHVLKIVCLILIALILLIMLILAILAFTVFKPKKPEIKLTAVALSDFSLSLSLLPPFASLNLTLDTTLLVKNPNKVGFQYDSSSAIIRYHDNVVGEAPIDSGRIGAGETKPMNVTLTLMGDKFVTDSKFVEDAVNKGTLPLNSFTKISGKVRVLGIKIGVVSSTSCDMEVSVAKQTVTKQSCTYKTEL